MIPVAAFALGFGTAAAWVIYVRAVAAQRPAKAALADLGILLISSAGVQLWALADTAFSVFVAFDVGAAIGTFCLVKWGHL